MADQNGSAAITQNVDSAQTVSDSKGKGKAAAVETHDVSMEGDDSSSEEELDEVCRTDPLFVYGWIELTNSLGCTSR